jgi:hypothetical protein
MLFFEEDLDPLSPEPSIETAVSAKTKKSSWPGISGDLRFSLANFIYSSLPPAAPRQDNDQEAAQENNLLAGQDLLTNKIYPVTQIMGKAVFAEQKLQIAFDSAELCGINLSGQWQSKDGITDGSYLLKDTKQLSFQETLPCLGIKQSVIEGDFKLQAKLSGSMDNWKNGNLTITSPNGVIRRMELLSKIFSLVNFTEFLTFKDLPDLDTEGLQYNDLVLESHIDQNELIIDKAFLKGKGLNLTGQGRMDLQDTTTNFTVFVAPFKMLDSVVTSIPLVGRIVGGKKGAILTFPVKVTGPIGDPNVSPLAPSAIGKATLDFITDTLTLPFAIFTPFKDGEKTDSEEPQE